jgi:hypothetical protein
MATNAAKLFWLIRGLRGGVERAAALRTGKQIERNREGHHDQKIV